MTHDKHNFVSRAGPPRAPGKNKLWAVCVGVGPVGLGIVATFSCTKI